MAPILVGQRSVPFRKQSGWDFKDCAWVDFDFKHRKAHQPICNAIQEALDTRGVKVTIKAEHHCMKTRGVHKDGIVMTSCATGALENTDVDGHYQNSWAICL